MNLTLCNMNTHIYWSGCYESQGVSSPVPIGDYLMKWYVVRNGVRTDSSKIITVFENDTTELETFY